MRRRPRVIAICVFRDSDRLLAFHIPEADEKGWRPVGGQVEWGETTQDAIAREVREELGVELVEPHLLTVIENLFTIQGREGHEVVFVYDARLPDPSLYEQEWLPFAEPEVGFEGRAYWKRLADFDAEGAQPLYPSGLLDFLKENP